MKFVLKFLVTILVIAVIGFTAGYMVMNGEKPVEEEPVAKSGEVLPDYSVEIVTSGEEITSTVESGEEVPFRLESKVEKIARIESIAQRQVFEPLESGEHVYLTTEYLSDSGKDVIKYFKLSSLGAIINQTEQAIRIVPDSDFVETMIYVYDEEGQLILYESLSTTVGGSTKYYFEKGVLIDTVVDYEEEVDVEIEKTAVILGRAKLLYEWRLQEIEGI